jgi:type I restriction-modification system DNA methylase subunit
VTPTIQEQVDTVLNGGDLKKLFIEVLGWDNTSGGTVTYQDPDSGVMLRAVPIAQKRGIPTYLCDSIPSSGAMAALERLAGARTVERLMIFTDGATQLWRWPETRRSGGTRYITHRHAVGSHHLDLLQRLAAVSFTMAEEPTLTVLTVRQRLQASFNADRVTVRFYNEFQLRQQSLRDSITGIPDDSDKSWYSSLLLNRLMFIYFMQRKGFLNGDLNYLRTSLTAIQELKGPNQFYEYYRDFLIPLFHHGLGADDDNPQDPAIQKLMGDVPYVNGGIFSKHTLEEQYDIHVPDATFIEIFDFFDRFRWHLDERPTGNPEEINPEVLGYIFERYVNRSETGGDSEGAYYTKEDVTGYMAGMTIPPLFIDRMIEATSESPWTLLVANPESYIPVGLRYGLQDPLPKEVEEADRYEAGLLEQLGEANVALPGERWREVLDRREYFEWLNTHLANGAVEDTNLAVTLNLDLQALALDWLSALTSPEDVATAYSILIGLRVLDPTCGSGAFLFAALDVLDELYEAVLVRAEHLVGAGKDTGDKSLGGVLEEVRCHPSTSFFVLKTIVLSNLYGVDLVEEATEIARLRLFLALVSRLERREELEPLPDLDMNILPGNALVGSATIEDISAHFGADLLASAALPKIVEEAESTARVYRLFVNAQREAKSGRQIERLKAKAQEERGALRDQLNALHSPKGPDDKGYQEWKRTHRPFHWFIEFPEVMLSGGFDVVCGNPPYVKRTTRDYKFSGFATDETKDIFAPCMERAASVLRPTGRLALIVPISFQFSADYNRAREIMAKLLPTRWCSTYSRNPSALFTAGLGVRSTILIGHRNTTSAIATTSLRRWYEDARPYLFDTARYAVIDPTTRDAPWQRTGDPDIARLYAALASLGGTLADATHRHGQFSLGFKQTALYYMSLFIDDPPAWMPSGERTAQTMIGYLKFQTEDVRDIAFCLLSGRLATWWWGATCDDFHVTSGLLGSFPIAPAKVEKAWPGLLGLAKQLRKEQPEHPIVTRYAGKEMGNYDMLRCRHITDQADRLVLGTLGLGHLWPALLLADDRLNKQTGERPGTEREWPFPWKPGE